MVFQVIKQKAPSLLWLNEVWVQEASPGPFQHLEVRDGKIKQNKKAEDFEEKWPKRQEKIYMRVMFWKLHLKKLESD